MNLEKFLEAISEDPPIRVDGQAVFLTGNPDMVPVALLHNLKHNKVMHTNIAYLNFRTREIPRVPNDQKVEVTKLGSGFYKIIAYYGFMEDPRIEHIFSLAKGKGLDFDPDRISYFLGREKLTISKKPGMWRWRIKLFSFMSRNALEASDFFKIPGSQIIELGVTLEI